MTIMPFLLMVLRLLTTFTIVNGSGFAYRGHGQYVNICPSTERLFPWLHLQAAKYRLSVHDIWITLDVYQFICFLQYGDWGE